MSEIYIYTQSTTALREAAIVLNTGLLQVFWFGEKQD